MQFINLQRQRQRINDIIRARIDSVLNHGQFILGPELFELEEKLAVFVGGKHCIGVSNGTDALLIALMVLGVGYGDEVITTPFAFVATVEMLELLGAKPVFVDIEPDTYNINPNLIEGAITQKTKAIMPVNLYGQPANYTVINQIAARYGIPVIEDAAQSLGAIHNGQASGHLAQIGCTSFFPSKPLGCYGDGGACFTDDDELAELLRATRSHGENKRYSHVKLGLNARLDTLQAAILLAKFTIFEDELLKRAEVAKRYNDLLAPLVDIPLIQEGNTSAYAQYTIAVDHRDVLIDAFKKAGIPIAVHYPMPLNLQPVLAHLKTDASHFPVAMEASQRVLSLPMDPYKTEDELQRVAAVIQSVSSRQRDYVVSSAMN